MGALVGLTNPNIYRTNNIADKMLEAISYRGESNESAIYKYKNTSIGTLGKDKLAHNNTEDIWAILDGEIFNLEEISLTLKESGYIKDKGHSQTEIILFAYECWGIDCFKKINGPFSIAIYDQRTEEIILARDHMGHKPLYWSLHNNHFIFASELKSIMHSGFIPQTPSKEGISAYLSLGFIPQDITAIKGVNKLLPGYFLKYSLKNSIRIKPFWSYSACFANKQKLSESDIIEKTDELLNQAISRRLNGNPAGCLLSGRLGSACIATYLKKLSKNKLSSLTAYFENEGLEDLKTAKEVSANLHIDNKTSLLTPDDICAELPKITWYLDEPLADPATLMTWKMSQLASSSGLKTVYSSIGSNRLFGMHGHYLQYNQQNSPKNIQQQITKKLLGYFSKVLHLEKGYQLANQYIIQSPLHNYIADSVIFDTKTLSKMSPDLNHCFNPEIFSQKFFRIKDLESINSFLYFESKTSLADSFLTQYDRLTSAFGLNYRTPFLDLPLVEFLATIPEDKQAYQGSTSFLLKSLLGDPLPATSINNPKINHPFMLTSWRQSKDFQDIMELLAKGLLVETGYINKKWLQKLSSPKYNPKYSSIQIWSLLSLEIWFRLFLNSSSFSSPPKMNIKELLSQ